MPGAAILDAAVCTAGDHPRCKLPDIFIYEHYVLDITLRTPVRVNTIKTAIRSHAGILWVSELLVLMHPRMAGRRGVRVAERHSSENGRHGGPGLPMFCGVIGAGCFALTAMAILMVGQASIRCHERGSRRFQARRGNRHFRRSATR